MKLLLERIEERADEVIEENLLMDMSEQKIVETISGENDVFVYTFTRACPTSFLTCC